MRFRFDAVDANTDVAIHEVDRWEVDAVAAECKARQLAGLTKTADGDHHVMSVHPFVVMQWLDRHGVSYAKFIRDQKLIERFLNDPDNSAFRIHQGRV
jgi:hypothetical protein